MPVAAKALIEIMTSLVSMWFKDYMAEANTPKPAPKPARIPATGETWELVRAGPHTAVVRVLIVAVADGFVSYSFTATPQFVNSQTVEYFCGVYTPTPL
jgi:hypothetical protein